MKVLLFLALAACARDPDKLLGDSNVYIEPLEVNDFEATQDTSTNIPGSTARRISAELHDGTILIEHWVDTSCDHTWDNVTVDSSEPFLIQIDYGIGDISGETCLFWLEYEIGIAGSELSPGLYKIKAMEDSTEIDLSEALSD